MASSQSTTTLSSKDDATINLAPTPPTTASTRKQKKKLTLGVGAECSVLVKFMHPARTVASVIVNATKNQRLEKLLVLREEMKVVKGKDVKCVIFRHDGFENVELYCVKRWIKIEKEGPSNSFFCRDKTVRNENNAIENSVINNDTVDDGIELPSNIHHCRNTLEDIATVRGLEAKQYR